jgi:hypothetical protein
VLASEAEKAAQRASAGDLPKVEQLPGRLNFDATKFDLRVQYLARLGLSGAIAALIAERAFTVVEPRQ